MNLCFCLCELQDLDVCGFGFGMIAEPFVQGLDFEKLCFIGLGLEIGAEDDVGRYFWI